MAPPYGLYIIGLALFLLNSFVYGSSWQARVLFLSGQVQSGNPPKQLKLLRHLPGGAKVQIGKGAKLVLQYPDGLFVLYEKAGHFIVGPKGKPQKRFQSRRLKSPKKASVDELAIALSVRGHEDVITLLSPKGVTRSNRPNFRFHLENAHPKTTFLITLESFDSGEVLFTHKLRDMAFSFPKEEAPLVRGGNYMWYVKCGSKQAEGEFFSVATEKVHKELAAIEQAARQLAQEFSEPQLFHRVMGEALLRQNFVVEAQAHLAH